MIWPKFRALAHECPRCGAKPHKACRKLNNIGPTRYLRVPHVERRDITNETASGTQRRAKSDQVAQEGAKAAWERANAPVPEWGWDALPDDEKAAWLDGGVA